MFPATQYRPIEAFPRAEMSVPRAWQSSLYPSGNRRLSETWTPIKPWICLYLKSVDHQKTIDCQIPCHSISLPLAQRLNWTRCLIIDRFLVINYDVRHKSGQPKVSNHLTDNWRLLFSDLLLRTKFAPDDVPYLFWRNFTSLSQGASEKNFPTLPVVKDKFVVSKRGNRHQKRN